MSDDRYILDGKSFVDTKTNQCLNFGIKDLARVTITLNNMDMWLNQAEERIAELEEQLDNSIRPKYKIGQKVWTEWKGMIVELTIKSLYWDINQVVEYRLKGGMYLMSRWEDEVFVTKEEAQAKLEELRGNDVKD